MRYMLYLEASVIFFYSGFPCVICKSFETQPTQHMIRAHNIDPTQYRMAFAIKSGTEGRYKWMCCLECGAIRERLDKHLAAGHNLRGDDNKKERTEAMDANLDVRQLLLIMIRYLCL